MKNTTHDADFHSHAQQYEYREPGCVFCDTDKMDPREILSENKLCYAKADLYPATKLHSLIIPKRHVPDFFSLFQFEISAAYSLLNELKTTIQQLDNTVTGFTIGANSGEDAGQTIFHCHIHLIPRRKGDTNNPRGGVRKAIMNTQER